MHDVGKYVLSNTIILQFKFIDKSANLFFFPNPEIQIIFNFIFFANFITLVIFFELPEQLNVINKSSFLQNSQLK